MTRRLVLRGTIALAGALWVATPPAAQGATNVVPLQGLTFAYVLTGVPETVSVADPTRRAEVRVEGSGPVEIRLVLPPALHAAGGAEVPLAFAYGDAAVAVGADAPLPFDPAQPVLVTIPDAPGYVTVYVGGTAAAAAGQAAGPYSATLAVVVSAPDS